MDANLGGLPEVWLALPPLFPLSAPRFKDLGGTRLMLDWNSTPMRVTLGVLLLLTGLMAGWFLHRSVFALPNVAMAMQYDDWRLDCPKLGDGKDGEDDALAHAIISSRVTRSIRSGAT